MKKLAISLIAILVLSLGSYTPAFACGHQHAEKCFVTTIDGGKTDQTVKTDVTIKTDETAGIYRTKATDQAGASGQTGTIDLAIWNDAIQIFWIGLLRTGLTW